MSGRVPLGRKARVAVTAWWSFARIVVALRRTSLPELVDRLGRRRTPATFGLTPRRLGVVVQKSLTIGHHEPRCLLSSLVLYDLLGDDGERTMLVIGLPDSPSTKDAHAWVEVDGVDVGPPPGRGSHRELARYG